MNRNLKISQIFGQVYLGFVFIFISFMYWDIYHIIQPDFTTWKERTLSNVYFIMFTLLFSMLVWCLIRSVISDPGKIPPFWGCYLDDPEHKKRRYCLICHIFKPERCHHCSVCGRCVLNMDHHCPWLNNCIGYMNRKFFLLLIFYVNVTVWFVIGGMLPYVYYCIHSIFSAEGKFSADQLFVLIPFMILVPFAFVIFKFFNFHINLITRNLTTLEHMDRERNKEPLDTPSPFDIGMLNNWHQVFGTNKLLWAFPVFGESGKPIGDGVTFKHRGDNLKELENNESSRQQLKKINDLETNHKNNTTTTTTNTPAIPVSANFIPPQYRAHNSNHQFQPQNESIVNSRSNSSFSGITSMKATNK